MLKFFKEFRIFIFAQILRVMLWDEEFAASLLKGYAEIIGNRRAVEVMEVISNIHYEKRHAEEAELMGAKVWPIPVLSDYDKGWHAACVEIYERLKIP
jgi:hypothetical protein